MNKFIRIVQNYLMFAFPFVAICAGWSTLQKEGHPSGFLWEILSWNLIVWFLVLPVFLVMLVVVPLAREKTLKRLANIKESDEREELITGKAARTTYISSLSILILFLFISIFTFNIRRIPDSEMVDGKSKDLSISLHFSLWDSRIEEKVSDGNTIIESKDIPLSKSALILVFIGWQLIAFNFAARKEQLQN